MKYMTTTGKTITAATRAEAEKITAEYGMGEIVGNAPTPPKPMRIERARKIWAQSQEWPRCGERWGMYPEERSAEAAMRAAGEWEEK